VIEEEEEPVLPEQRSAAFRDKRDDTPRIEEMDPTVSPREHEPITKERAAIDPKTDRVSTNKIKH
jgi:hypothetical protein